MKNYTSVSSPGEKKVLIVGAGLAGTDAALYLASHGVSVVLIECKSFLPNPAQKLKTCTELVCTNSLKSLNPHSTHGLLKHEMNLLGSHVLEIGQSFRVPAGDALAVDREKFSQAMTERLKSHPLIQFIDEEVVNPLETQEKYGCHYTIIATGPLTTPGLEKWMQKELSPDNFYFYDAIAPIVDGDSLDYSKLYFKDRYKKEDESADYLNAPMTKEQYELFIDELIKAEKVPAKDFEEYKYFESCLPIDTMAERGRDTARFSCMKPKGLDIEVDSDDPTQAEGGRRPYAVVQLRKENLLGDAYNLVGFQTRLTYKEQLRVFRLIPGLENAQFIHLGSVHRNSFLNAKNELNFDLSSKKFPTLHFAGQITGVEGYTESAMCGLYVGFQLLRKMRGEESVPWPVETATGALINYLMTAPKPIPSNVHFGLFPPVTLTREQRRHKDKKMVKKQLMVERAHQVLAEFLQKQNQEA